MDYINLAQQALVIFEELIDGPSKKEQQAALDKVKGNEYAEQLLEVVKNKSFAFKSLNLSKKTEGNEGRIRLQNLLDVLDVLKNDSATKEVVTFVLRNADELETKVYQAILTGGITLPAAKEQAKTNTKK